VGLSLGSRQGQRQVFGRLSVWGPGVASAAVLCSIPFVHYAEFRAVMAPLAVLLGMQAVGSRLVRQVSRQVSPVEEAWSLGYHSGFMDGEACGLPRAGHVRAERRTGVDRRGGGRTLAAVPDDGPGRP
jgi:hypothetical protein